MNSCVPEGLVVPAPLVTLVVLLSNVQHEPHLIWKSCWTLGSMVLLLLVGHANNEDMLPSKYAPKGSSSEVGR